ncbi:hypothetical protein B0T17DRAFT_8043 [Bombardia bombarda]|uniref:Secreted protein n=1 Tax=Bombardia bombarda TaxID=252184 RepID=A0AA39XK26_9PEZI|nr:hypothetical protein B0T17DRAFT_8043 [Bombardia bombarda]
MRWCRLGARRHQWFVRSLLLVLADNHKVGDGPQNFGTSWKSRTTLPCSFKLFTIVTASCQPQEIDKSVHCRILVLLFLFRSSLNYCVFFSMVYLSAQACRDFLLECPRFWKTCGRK